LAEFARRDRRFGGVKFSSNERSHSA